MKYSAAFICLLSISFTAGAGTPLENPQKATYREKILNLAANSSCAQVKWQGQGQSPIGFIKGVTLSFAHSLCRQKNQSESTSSPVSIMSMADTRNNGKDSITYYSAQFLKNNYPIKQSGPGILKSIYTFALGVGMRESSGIYCQGSDRNASNRRRPETLEVGAYQYSYNSLLFHQVDIPELNQLYTEYKANPQWCNLDVFKEGINKSDCENKISPNKADAYEFQRFSISCPAFATEYAIMLFRTLRTSFGTINNKLVELRGECFGMLGEVEKIINENPRAACEEI